MVSVILKSLIERKKHELPNYHPTHDWIRLVGHYWISSSPKRLHRNQLNSLPIVHK